MIDLSEKTAIITGGSRGIGAACSTMFAEVGADVVVCYNSQKAEAESVSKKVESFGRRCLLVQADLSKKEAVDKLFEQVLNFSPQIDILVNNHGIWTGTGIDEMSEEVWDTSIAINLKSVYYLCHKFVPVMKKQNFGNIINITSTAGQRGEAFHSNYASTKGALIAFTKSLSTELAPHNILVNSIAPGWVDTEMNDEIFADPAVREAARIGIPLKRIPSAEDIAGPILFMASPLARHITGEILNVNGGAVLCG